MSDSKGADELGEPIKIETAPDTGDVHFSNGETDLSLSVEKGDDGSVSISASAWDSDGVGIGGVSITLPESVREDVAKQIDTN